MKHALTWASFATAGALLAFALAFLAPAGAFAQDRVCPISDAMAIEAQEAGMQTIEFDSASYALVIGWLQDAGAKFPWSSDDAPTSAILISHPGANDVVMLIFVQPNRSSCHRVVLRGELATRIILLVLGRGT